MSNEVVTDPATGEPVDTTDAELAETGGGKTVVGPDGEEITVPQGPGDAGYQAPLIVPELDLEGGTVFKVGEDEYGSMSEAAEAIAPPEEDAEVVEDDDEQLALEEQPAP